MITTRGTFRRPRSRTVRTTAYAATTVVAVLLATSAHGSPTRRLELHDGGIWVTSEADHALGRFNKQIGQLDAAVFPSSGEATGLDVLQDGATVLAWDRGGSTLTGVDAAKRSLAGDGGVALTAGSQAGLGGGSAAVLTPKGALYVTRLGERLPDVSALASTAAPLLTVSGSSPALAVGTDGSVIAVTADQLTVVRVRNGGFARPSRTALPGIAKPQVTAVGGLPVVLDPDTGTVLMPTSKRTVRIPGVARNARLQQPGPDAGVVAVADDQSLWLVPLSGGSPRRAGDVGTSNPAAPARAGRCVHAAWGGGGTAYVKWCDGSPPTEAQRYAQAGGPAPVFRVNRGQAVLNEAVSGMVVLIDDAVRPVTRLWERIKPAVVNQPPHEGLVREQLPHNAQDRPPAAVDDSYGARPDRATVLHVLDNDTDPEGDLLVVSSVKPADVAGATVSIAPDGQSVVVTAPAGAARELRFQYTADDGYGKSSTASVVVALRGDQDNERPKPRPRVTRPALSVAPGGTLRLPVLADWRDFDGDPLLVVPGASTAGSVAVTSDGRLLVTAPSAPGRFDVAYSVTDGLGEPVTAQRLAVTVLDPRGSQLFSPPVAQPDAIRVSVGQPVTVEPLANDIPGADATDPQARLTIPRDVAARPGLQLSTDSSRGTVTILATRAGSYPLSYVAAFGAARTVSGILRVDAHAASPGVAVPVTMPDSAVVRGQQPVLVDVLANDVDPAGGVLVVQDATGDDDAGLSVSVVNSRELRIVADAAMTTAGTGAGTASSASVRYRVTNGRGDPVTGSVSVTRLAAPETNDSPLALDDAAVVRAGDSTSVSVLENDFDPDGDPLSLAPLPVAVDPAVPGAVAAVSGSAVRFAAPVSVTQPQQVTLEYVAVDPFGHRATGHVAVSVVPAAGADQPPTPTDLEGRLVAGDTYVVHVPVYGVDPDGDSVTVTGVTEPPSLGRIVGIGADSVSYQAYPSSAGTDTFTYEVVDRFGQSGLARVRLGVVPPGALSPAVAVDDTIAAAPGRTVRVDVTRNDLVSPGGHATVLPLAEAGEVPAGVTLDGTTISVPAPRLKADPVVVAYSMTDGTSAPSVGHLTVRAEADALLPPVARDDAPGATAAAGGAVTVDVLANDDDPDGDDGTLRVAPFDPDVAVSGGRLTIRVQEQPRQVAYVVTDADGLTSVAAVRVPGSDSARPRVKRGARPRVSPGGTLTVRLADIAESPAHKTLRLTTTDRIAASPSAGLAVTARDATTLVLRAVGDYAGPGALSVEVTDGKSLQDKQGQVVRLTVPVQVGPDAPALRCPASPVLVVAGGEDVAADLMALCHVWLDTTVAQPKLSFDAGWATRAKDVTASVKDATRLVVTAASAARPGTSGALALTVPGTPAKAQLSIAVKAAPVAKARAVTLTGLRAERPSTVDLAQYVSSQLREPRLSVVSVQQTSGRPVTTKVSGTRVTITPGHDTFGAVGLLAVVSDVPNRPDREVRAGVTAQVQGRPARPDRPAVVSEGNGQLVISWRPPADNGAPITKYRIGHAGRAVSCHASPCTVGGLHNGAAYSLTVTAVNVVGESDESTPSPAGTPDKVPDAVGRITITPADTRLGATWAVPGGGGTRVVDYQVQIRPAPLSGASVRTVTSPSVSFTSLDNGVTYRIRVRARNLAHANGGYGAWSGEAAGVPFGTPLTMAAPSARGADVPDPATTRAITVSWPAADGNGRAITRYTVAQYVDTSASGSFATLVDQVSGSPSSFARSGGFATSFTVQNDGKFYVFTVRATNAGAKESAPSPKSAAVQGAAPPSRVTTVTAKDHEPGSTAGYNGALHAVFTLPSPNSSALTSVEYQLNGTPAGSWPNPGSPGSAFEGAIAASNGASYVVQVRGCNDANLCGPWSDPSNAVVPYGPPAPPNVTADRNGNVVSYTWNGGGGNGRAVDHYHVCIDGGCSDRGAGSFSKDYGYSAPWSISVSLVDAAGQVSGTVTRSGTTPPAPPTIVVSKGAPHTSSTCTSSTCQYVHVTVSNFAPNTRYGIAYWCDYPSACSPWSTNNFTTNGAGAASFEGQAWYGYTGHHVWVVVNGVESNHLLW